MISALSTIDDVACTVCGCVCDDLTVRIEGERIIETANACAMARAWFAAQDVSQKPVAMIDNQPASFEAATSRAAAILKAAKSPLIYGLARSSTAGQRAAIALADKLGATIDLYGDHAGTIAMQQVGESTCTLGEVKSRADFALFWGCDPVTTHQRFLERYVRCPIMVVDAEETATAKHAAAFLGIDRDQYWQSLWTLRLLVAGKAVTNADPALMSLAQRMKKCRWGIIFHGDDMPHRTVEAMYQLVTDLNDFTRFYARHLRRGTSGAGAVLTWQTGYPFGVNFAAGYPRYNPGEFTAPEMLARKEIDACLLLGSDCTVNLPAAALEHLQSIPVIRIDSPSTICELKCRVSFNVAVVGIHTQGSVQRLDDITLPLKAILPTIYPSDADVIERIILAADVTDSLPDEPRG